MSQLAVLSACQMPLRSGLPSAVRGALYPAGNDDARCAAGAWPSTRRLIVTRPSATSATPAIETDFMAPLRVIAHLHSQRRGGASAFALWAPADKCSAAA